MVTAQSGASNVHDIVMKKLSKIEAGGYASALENDKKFDKYEGDIILTAEDNVAASALVSDNLVHAVRMHISWQQIWWHRQSTPITLPSGWSRLTVRVSQLEGLEDHARADDVRLAQYFPGKNFDLGADG